RLSGPPRSSVASSQTAPPPPYHARTASMPRSVVTPPRSGTIHSTSSARTSSTAPRSKFAARPRLPTSTPLLPTTRAYVSGPLRIRGRPSTRAPSGAETAQILVDQGDRHRAFADRRRDALDRALAHVARDEEARMARLEEERRAIERP